MNRLEGKVAVITGANSGVGAETAKLFASEGATVVISARRLEPLNEVAEEIRNAGGTVEVVKTDISDNESCKALINTAVEKFGKLDILVNNAGVLEEGLKPIDRFTDEDYDFVTSINENGTMNCIRAATNVMGEWASIVNVASIAGEYGCGGAVYVASKAAIIGITKHTAMRFADAHIRCNAVCPETILTPMVAGMNQSNMDIDMITQMSKHTDIRATPCTPKDVANVILFLASDEAKPITGQAIISDYGSTV